MDGVIIIYSAGAAAHNQGMAGKSFKGNLEILNLSDIFQSLAMNRHSGTLVVNDGKREKKIFFAEGEILLLSSGRRMRLGDLLIANGKITEEDLDLALKLQKQSRKKLGEILVEEGFCEDEDIARILRLQVEEELYDLFLWRKAEFEFLADQMPDDMARESPNLTRLNINTNSLIMEALRRLDEWSLIQDAVPTTKEVFVVVDGDKLHEAEVPETFKGNGTAIDGKTTVMGLAERFFVSEFECCQHLATLVKAGAIRALEQDELVEEAEKAYALNDFQAAAALYGRLAEYHPDEAKILIPLADSLRRTGVEKQALAIYEVLANKLEKGGKDPDRLRQCYEAILQLDPSRVDLARRIEDLDLRIASSPAKRGLVPILLVILLLVSGGVLFAFKDKLLPEKTDGDGSDVEKQLEAMKRAEEEAEQLVDKGKLDEAEVQLAKWHAVAVELWEKHGKNAKVFAKIELPLLVSTVPPGFDVHVNGDYQGHTTLQKQYLVCTHRPADLVKVEIYEKNGKKDGRPPVLPAVELQAKEYNKRVRLAVYEKPRSSIFGVGHFDVGVAREAKGGAFLAPCRNGKLRVFALKNGRLTDFEGRDDKVVLGEYGDRLSPPVVHGKTLLVGATEFKGGYGVLAVDLPGGAPNLRYRADAQVVAAPLVIPAGDDFPKGRVVFGSLGGVVYAYTLKGELVWKYLGDGPVQRRALFLDGSFRGAPKGLVVVCSDDAHVRAYAAASGTRPVWSHGLKVAIDGAPILFRSEVLVPLVDGSIAALDPEEFAKSPAKATARITYRDPGKKRIAILAGPKGEVLYVGNQDGAIRALERGKTKLWEKTFPAISREQARPVPLLALQSEDRLLVAHDGPEMYALDLKLGKIVWQAKFPQKGRVISPISVFGSSILVGTDQQILYQFEGASK